MAAAATVRVGGAAFEPWQICKRRTQVVCQLACRRHALCTQWRPRSHGSTGLL